MSSGTHDRVWLITGASSGFGRALAEAAVALGDTVVGAARRVERLDELAREHPGRFHPIELDVTDTERGGQVTAPGFGAYCATEFALEGLTESLSQEVEFAPFLIVEPGAFRTDLFARDAAVFSEPMSEYDGTVGPTRDYVRTGGGPPPGDSAKAAQAIITAISAEHPPLRLALGGEAADGVAGRLQAFAAELAEWQPVGRATGLDSQPTPAPS